MSAGENSVMVWDPVVRIFHWTVVAGCLANLFILEDLAHEVIGYVVAAALAVRIVWGFVGTPYARFNDFVPGPRRLREYLTLLARGREPRRLGHNPAAAVMMLVLMALLAAIVVVTNTILVSVTQRTREIGVRRALGATRGQIMREVLAESALVAAVGGAAGPNVRCLMIT